MSEEIKTFQYIGKNAKELRAKIDEQYRKDIATLELANDSQMKELLKDFGTPEDLSVKYVEVIAKKSRLAHHKRELIQAMFEPIVKRTAIDIINQRESKEKKTEEQPCSSEEHKKTVS